MISPDEIIIRIFSTNFFTKRHIIHIYISTLLRVIHSQKQSDFFDHPVEIMVNCSVSYLIVICMAFPAKTTYTLLNMGLVSMVGEQGDKSRLLNFFFFL